MKQKDRLINPLIVATIVTTVLVKAVVTLFFVVLVYIAGSKNIEKNPVVETPSINPVIVDSGPLPNISIGLTSIPKPIIEPTFTSTIVENTPTDETINTSIPATLEVIKTITPTVKLSPTQTITPTASSTIAPTTAVAPSKTATSIELPLFTPSAIGLNLTVTSPLQGIGANELSSIISQVFEAPATGEDSGHHGVDFAFWTRGDLQSIEGIPIKAVFSGKVASAYNKPRNPYGYMVIVETPLSTLPPNFLEEIQLPTETATSNPSNRLTCPAGFADWWSTDSKSLYVLYGHMQDVPEVKLSDNVYEGDLLGYVGNSGASSAPHLHVEMRIGPSNASFTSMGHYDTTTTELERHNYCMWRVSGKFQVFDPMQIFNIPQQ